MQDDVPSAGIDCEISTLWVRPREVFAKRALHMVPFVSQTVGWHQVVPLYLVVRAIKHLLEYLGLSWPKLSHELLDNILAWMMLIIDINKGDAGRCIPHSVG